MSADREPGSGSMRDVAAATLVRSARVLVEAALTSAELIPHVTLAQRPHIDAVRGYAREALMLLDAAQAPPSDGSAGDDSHHDDGWL